MEEIKNDTIMTKLSSLLKKAHKSFILYLLPIPFLFWLLIANFTSSEKVLPLQNDFKITKQSDAATLSEPFGTDDITHIDNFEVTDTSATITFVLGSQIAYPYAGLLFHTYVDTLDSTMLDLSSSDYIEFELSAEGGKREVNLYFSEFIDGYTSLDTLEDGSFVKNMSWRTYEYQLAAEEDMKHYRISLEDFKTDNWWFKQQDVSSQKIPDKTFKKIINLVVENGNYENKEIPLTITIKNIRFGRNFLTTNIVAVILTILYYLLYFFVVKFGIRRVMGPVVIPYKQLDVTSYLDEDTKKIEDYVAVNYTNPDLTVKKLCTDTGITHAKVQAILKKQFQLTFRQYLNKIKIHEAKRILLETDRQVTDIAYRVGYKNVTHFNRIFKETEGLSPNQFRKSNGQ